VSNVQDVRVRFAPSPTGYLHIGGARTCLFNWLYVRALKGTFVLRVEDTDTERSKKEYLDEILESIQWLGMDWDELYYQSKRFDIYREYSDKLISQGKAYHKDGAVFFKYDFNRIEVDDLIRGKIIFNELPKDEEVIIKSDGTPTYNFCCCVDDALMNINCIIRGEDHIPNTPKQVLIYEGLGFSVPKFAHVPLILSPTGGRLSKRFGATSIREYKDQGYLSSAISNYLLLLGWSPGENREILNLSEAKDIFNIKDVNKTGAVFSIDKLNWVNGEYLRAKEKKDFSLLAYDFMTENKFLTKDIEKGYALKVVGLFQERISKLQDLSQCTAAFFCDTISYSEDASEILNSPIVKELTFLIERFKETDDFTQVETERVFRKAVEDLGVKMKILVHPTRIALTGIRHGPGLFETIAVLGKEKVIKRLENLITHWEEKNE
jgi:glutamyl-tRNA synthetase